jgi:hypothetical protein
MDHLEHIMQQMSMDQKEKDYRSLCETHMNNMAYQLFEGIMDYHVNETTDLTDCIQYPIFGYEAYSDIEKECYVQFLFFHGFALWRAEIHRMFNKEQLINYGFDDAYLRILFDEYLEYISIHLPSSMME